MDANQVSQQAAQPPASGQQQTSSTQETKPPEPLSAEDIRKIAREEALKTSQSLTDKAEARVKKQLDLLRKAEVSVTDDQKAKIRSDIISQVMSEEGGRADHQSQEPQPQGQVTPAVKEALDIMAEEGTQIEDGDPELADLLKVLQDPQAGTGKRARAVLAAITAKRNRLNQNADTAHLRTPAGGGEPPQPTAKSAHELWNQAFKKG